MRDYSIRHRMEIKKEAVKRLRRSPLQVYVTPRPTLKGAVLRQITGFRKKKVSLILNTATTWPQ